MDSKNWNKVQDIQLKKLNLLNKVIVRKSVLFYAEAWRHRNEVLHEPLKYKSFVIEWHKNIDDLINRENRPEMKKNMRT